MAPVQVDLGTILLALCAIGVVTAFAVIAGTVSARVFFDVTRDTEDR